MKTTSFAVAVAAASLASPALAQERDLPHFRVEGRIGWDRSAADALVTNPDENPNQTGDEVLSRSASESGPSYGVEAGFDMMLGTSSFLVGVYGGADYSDNQLCAEVFDEDLGCAQTGLTINAGVRAGYAVNPNLLVYATGGYSNGELDIVYDGDVDDDDNELFELSDNRGGYHAGAGIELAFTRHLYAKLEYRYTNYGTLTHSGEDDDDDEIAASVTVDRHQAMAGFGFRF